MTDDDDEVNIQKIRFFDSNGHLVSMYDIGKSISLKVGEDNLTIILKAMCDEDHAFIELLGVIKNYHHNGGEDVLENPCA